MRGVVLFSAIVAGFCFYFVLQLLFGAYSLSSLRQTREYTAALESHIEQLQRIQERLKEDVIALQVNESRIEEEARRIGYYDRRDIVIHRPGDERAAVLDNTFGHYLSPADIRGDTRALFRWIAFSFGLLCLIIFSLLDGRRTDG